LSVRGHRPLRQEYQHPGGASTCATNASILLIFL
jgi:hypothetical protein